MTRAQGRSESRSKTFGIKGIILTDVLAVVDYPRSNCDTIASVRQFDKIYLFHSSPQHSLNLKLEK